MRSSIDLQVWPLVHAKERFAAASGEQLGDRLVGQDHQLLDDRVRTWLRLDPRSSDATVSVELEGDLAGLDTQGATPIAPRRSPSASSCARPRASPSSPSEASRPARIASACE